MTSSQQNAGIKVRSNSTNNAYARPVDHHPHYSNYSSWIRIYHKNSSPSRQKSSEPQQISPVKTNSIIFGADDNNQGILKIIPPIATRLLEKRGSSKKVHQPNISQFANLNTNLRKSRTDMPQFDPQIFDARPFFDSNVKKEAKKEAENSMKRFLAQRMGFRKGVSVIKIERFQARGLNLNELQTHLSTIKDEDELALVPIKKEFEDAPLIEPSFSPERIKKNRSFNSSTPTRDSNQIKPKEPSNMPTRYFLKDLYEKSTNRPPEITNIENRLANYRNRTQYLNQGRNLIKRLPSEPDNWLDDSSFFDKSNSFIKLQHAGSSKHQNLKLRTDSEKNFELNITNDTPQFRTEPSIFDLSFPTELQIRPMIKRKASQPTSFMRSHMKVQAAKTPIILQKQITPQLQPLQP